MPSASARFTVSRQWALLRLIPGRGAGATARQLQASLAQAGFAVSKRQVERDLKELEQMFGLICNDKSMPFSWRWPPHGAAELPALTLAEALSVKLIEEALRPLLPAPVLRVLEPRFANATAKLAALRGANPTARWQDKARAVPPALPRVPPLLDEEVLEAVQLALLHEEAVSVTYRSSAGKQSSLRIHPLGIVVRPPATYLVGIAQPHSDIRLYALHRFVSAQRTHEQAPPPKGFSLDDYLAQGNLQFGSPKPAALTLRVNAELAASLREAPLSKFQRIESDGEAFIVSAQVPDTWQLRWWLFSQAAAVEVLKPKALREQIAAGLSEAAALYEPRACRTRKIRTKSFNQSSSSRTRHAGAIKRRSKAAGGC